eukprot:Lithocolla_globosa_v1_NODE_3289_length_1710_cov_47.843505.p3 type:complete len:118 gc:universal NODE_3289_length_1710_cov_47.843505:1111-1464(+)
MRAVCHRRWRLWRLGFAQNTPRWSPLRTSLVGNMSKLLGSTWLWFSKGTKPSPIQMYRLGLVFCLISQTNFHGQWIASKLPSNHVQMTIFCGIAWVPLWPMGAEARKPSTLTQWHWT